MNRVQSGTIFDIKHFSTHDGPGIRTTVFLKGCPLACLWCHNPESQSPRPELLLRPNLCIACLACLEACPQEAIFLDRDFLITDRDRCDLCGVCVEVCHSGAREISGYEISVTELMKEIRKDIPFYDQSGGGVTFSGGEPLLQADFLLEALQACRELELNTALDTCGHMSYESIEPLLPWVDLVLYDLKAQDADLHRRLTGVRNEMLLKNLQKISQIGKKVRVRFPLVPGLNDTLQELSRLGEFCSALPGLESLEILPYHRSGIEKYARLQRDYKLENTNPPDQERLEETAAFLKGFGLQVLIGG